MDIISSIFNSHGIELFSAVDFSNDFILYPEKFERTISKYGLSDIRTVIIFAVPYYTGLKTNVSAYAAAGDYHKLLGKLNSSIIEDLKRNFPCSVFTGLADNSPLNELKIAESANIGSRGDNGIMLTRRYSSFVFLSTIVTDMILDHEILPEEDNSNICLHCGACRRACPVNIDDKTTCLSYVSQKKGSLSAEEIKLMKDNSIIWGCDICQMSCPVTVNAIRKGSIFTSIPYFAENHLGIISSETITSMSDEEFENTAFAWKGRKTILRNLGL